MKWKGSPSPAVIRTVISTVIMATKQSTDELGQPKRTTSCAGLSLKTPTPAVDKASELFTGLEMQNELPRDLPHAFLPNMTMT